MLPWILLALLLNVGLNPAEAYVCDRVFEYDATIRGEIKSPGYETGKYPEESFCHYRIKAPQGHKIKLTFKDLDIDPIRNCASHRFEVAAGARDKLYGTFCGDVIPYPIVTKDDNELLLTFAAEESVFGRGFHVEYESGPDLVQSDEPFQCHDLYEYDASTKGEVTSPFYGERSYPEELWCEYRITAPEGNGIKLTFKDFDVEPSGRCIYDQLVVYSKDKDEVLWKFCGRNSPNPIISKEGENEIRLLFRTDFIIGGRGFRIKYESGLELELCSNERQCRNRNCYKAEKKCDGVDDCGDGTDEEWCENRVVQPPKSCGTPSFQPITSNEFPDRQVGGIEVVPHSWPWQVSLQEVMYEPNGHICGGTLINPQWVLTAAHCASRTMTPMDMKVVIGSHNKFEKSKYQVVRMAEKIISYPDLQFQKLVQYNIKHDIALIKLNAPVTFNDAIQAACLPKPGWELEIGSICMAIGWGETRGSGFSDMLKQSEVIMQDKYHCGYDAKSQICVARNYSAPCHGDSGSPLLCKYSGKWYVMGAASMGLSTNDLNVLCALPGSKVLFSKAADKIEWIQEVVDKYS